VPRTQRSTNKSPRKGGWKQKGASRGFMNQWEGINRGVQSPIEQISLKKGKKKEKTHTVKDPDTKTNKPFL